MNPFITVLIVAQSFFILGIIWIAIHYRSRHLSRKAEERSRLLDRFNNPQELLDFFDSDGGRKYLEIAGGGPKNTLRGLALAFGLGASAIFGGLGFMVLHFLGITPGGMGFMLLSALLILGGGGIVVGALITRWIWEKSK